MKRKSYYKKTRNIKNIINFRFNFLYVFMILFFGLIFFNLFNITVLKNEYYKELALKNKTLLVESDSAPRGRIYDRNNNLLIDNKAVKTIYYLKPQGITTKEELELSYKLADLIEVDFSNLHITNLKEFWLANNKKLGNLKILDLEMNLYKERKLSLADLYDLKMKRITKEELNIYNDRDKEAAYIYYLMKKGYYYDRKTIKKGNVTDKEYALIATHEEELKGIGVKLDWERVYLYGDIFKPILGNVSSIPYELKEYYLENGYSLDDRVGVTNLELEYEEYLKGKKAIYELTNEGAYNLIEEGKRGSDLILTIDIELQVALEEILKREVLRAKKEANTEYYDGTFVVISDPKTGEILAMSGKQVTTNEDGEYIVYDYTKGIINAIITPGSVVKGASISVGYNEGVLEINEVKNDKCIKIKNTPKKCSWKYLGNINDIRALAMSSNSYQYQIAIDVAKGNYAYNGPLIIDKSAFETYRKMYASYGLGVLSEIDLPGETIGYKGQSLTSGLLLDFSVGQYDNYTTIQLSNYINTLANSGVRMQTHLLKEVYDYGKLIYTFEPQKLSVVDIDEKYIKRIQEGFIEVMKTGTGRGYISSNYLPAGKTGTSESFVDTDNDGNIDTKTTTKNFVGYAPYDNPIMSITITSPNISNPTGTTSHISSINSRISREITTKFFEIY